MERPFKPGEGFSGQIPFENPEKWRRRRLPHYNAAGIYQMITYRLADSLPHDVVVRMKQRYGENYEDLLKPQDSERSGSTARSAADPARQSGSTARSAADPARQSDRLRAEALRKSLEEVMDSGYGSCLLRRPDFAERVIEAWRFHEGVRYRIIAFVVMPNHVHILIEVLSGWSLGQIVWSWKNWVSSHARRHGLRLSSKKSLWQREYWDRFIRDEQHFHAAIAYIEQNPVAAGLCARREDWPWMD